MDIQVVSLIVMVVLAFISAMCGIALRNFKFYQRFSSKLANMLWVISLPVGTFFFTVSITVDEAISLLPITAQPYLTPLILDLTTAYIITGVPIVMGLLLTAIEYICSNLQT